ncbi:MAG: TOBE domain-containing protein, partial [Acidimicrobiales bacterium]
THDQAEAFALADMIGVLCDGKLVQLGSPEEVYERPATPFVARFTGLAGELTVIPIEPGGDGEMVIRLADMDTSTGAEPMVARAPSGAKPGVTASLLVRPAAVRLLPPGHPERHLDAVVLDTAYRGRGYDHALLLSNGEQLLGVHDDRRWNRGDNVAAALLPRGCLLFPHEAPQVEPEPIRLGG